MLGYRILSREGAGRSSRTARLEADNRHPRFYVLCSNELYEQTCDSVTGLTRRCSSDCFKKHKVTWIHKYLALAQRFKLAAAAAASSPDTKMTSAPVSDIQRSDHVDEASKVLEKLQLESAASSSDEK
ncbi:uncharacterized protein LOC131332123 [Rhododendron vialii]|uniref:uncharacterized protein LOC131332123 n=1 Tax=Rhododendron vialii TaxID=182163 RepID=UPI00265F4F0C|nr:uncharacterized protein LOC131332123 [Rhododendron vialii]